MNNNVVLVELDKHYYADFTESNYTPISALRRGDLETIPLTQKHFPVYWLGEGGRCLHIAVTPQPGKLVFGVIPSVQSETMRHFLSDAFYFTLYGDQILLKTHNPFMKSKYYLLNKEG